MSVRNIFAIRGNDAPPSERPISESPRACSTEDERRAEVRRDFCRGTREVQIQKWFAQTGRSVILKYSSARSMATTHASKGTQRAPAKEGAALGQISSFKYFPGPACNL